MFDAACFLCYNIFMKKYQNRKRKKSKTKDKYIIRFLLVFWEVLLAGLLFGTIGIYLIGKLPMGLHESSRTELSDRTAPEWEPIVKGEETTGQNPADESESAESVDEQEAAPDDEERLPEENVIQKETRIPGEVTLLFAGDTLFDDSYSPMVSLKQRPGGVQDCFSKELLAEMTTADIFMLNNEFTFTSRGEPLPDKSYTFRANPEIVKYLFDMGADIVSLANNHTFDWGEISLLDTLNTLDAAGMPRVGAGRNLKEASAPVYFDAGGLRIGFLAATQIERMSNPPTRGAAEETPGVFRCLDPTALYDAVREAKKNCDYLIVFVHWGTEKTDQPDWAQLEQGPGLAEAGADLIIGAHPHVLQGLESANGVPVVYSLGNFWFNSYTQDTCVVKVTLGADGLKSFQFLPALQKGCITALTEGEEKQRVLQYIQSLSPNVVIDKEGYVTFM